MPTIHGCVGRQKTKFWRVESVYSKIWTLSDGYSQLCMGPHCTGRPDKQQWIGS